MYHCHFIHAAWCNCIQCPVHPSHHNTLQFLTVNCTLCSSVRYDTDSWHWQLALYMWIFCEFGLFKHRQIFHISKRRCHIASLLSLGRCPISILRQQTIASISALWHNSKFPFQSSHPQLEKLRFDMKWPIPSEIYVFPVTIRWFAVWNASG